jgi:ribonuclease G
MLKEIIINSLSDQTRVAISEDGKLVDFFVEYPENRRMVGDVYLGRVARVLPGIRAAFIDIGMKHDAFLHFSDIGERTKDFQQMIEDDDEVAEAGPSRQPKMINGVPVLQKGERILIQITKEPVANKGVRVSSSISIPGRFCVLLPLDNKVGVSKKISDYRERRRLRAIARGILPKNCGLIIRTVARKQSEEAVRDDLKNLLAKWNKIEEDAKTGDPPKLIHQDVSTTSSVIRDLFTPDVSKVFIDSRKLHREVRDYIETVQPQLASKVEHYKPSVPIFEAFKIEEKIKELFGRKVALKSGGYLMIEHTEAMWVIDVNSGKYAANKEQEMNSLKTDLEAAREIVRQLRLRDIGGLIVVDFIDLEQDRNRKKVYDELKKEFRRDRAKVSLLPMSDFGLIEITRQRIRQNIMQAVKEVCPYCLGTGTLTKRSHILYDIEGFLKKHRQAGGERSIILRCHPTVAMKLREGCFITTLTRLQMKYLSRIRIVEDNTLGMDQFRFIDRKTNEDLSDKPI